jgi:hypothetical protein
MLMSLAPALKFITIIESERICPKVLSVGQILRALGLFVFLIAATTCYSLSLWLDAVGQTPAG